MSKRRAAQIEADLGEIDIWINNAMASVFSPVKEMTPEEFRRARKQEEIHEEAETKGVENRKGLQKARG